MKQNGERRIGSALGGSGDINEGWTGWAPLAVAVRRLRSGAASQTGRSVAVRQPDRAVRWRAR
jgi:hypothetical protein